MNRDQLLARLRRGAGKTGIPGDGATSPGGEGFAPGKGPLCPAAVLVGLVERREGFNVLLTRRTENLEHHPGQISFPGGHIEKTDPSIEAAAIRETVEETGIGADFITVVSRLGTYETRTGFAITPVVSLIEPGFEINPDPLEVAEVFEVPLGHFLDPARHRIEEVDIGGKTRRFYAMPYGDYYIWGATAGILFNLYRVVKDGENS